MYLLVLCCAFSSIKSSEERRGIALDVEGVRLRGVLKITGGTYYIYNSYALGGTPNETAESVTYPIGNRTNCINQQYVNSVYMDAGHYP
jgi:hypothetical protein|tara:strand:+ start:269 stop:535 length:267 start_codon:yes stop_codon:yes gene_type:complete